MAHVIELDENVWHEFATAAKQDDQKPETLLLEIMRNFIEIRGDEKLHKELAVEAKKSNLSENDTVDFVKHYRTEKAK